MPLFFIPPFPASCDIYSPLPLVNTWLHYMKKKTGTLGKDLCWAELIQVLCARRYLLTHLRYHICNPSTAHVNFGIAALPGVVAGGKRSMSPPPWHGLQVNGNEIKSWWPQHHFQLLLQLNCRHTSPCPKFRSESMEISGHPISKAAHLRSRDPAAKKLLCQSWTPPYSPIMPELAWTWSLVSYPDIPTAPTSLCPFPEPWPQHVSFPQPPPSLSLYP